MSLQDFLGLRFSNKSCTSFCIYMFELKRRVTIDGFDHLNATVVVKFIFSLTDHMVATDIRCDSGETVGKSLSNLL